MPGSGRSVSASIGHLPDDGTLTGEWLVLRSA